MTLTRSKEKRKKEGKGLGREVCPYPGLTGRKKSVSRRRGKCQFQWISKERGCRKHREDLSDLFRSGSRLGTPSGGKGGGYVYPGGEVQERLLQKG